MKEKENNIKQSAKCDSFELSQRVYKVYTLMLHGKPRHEIVRMGQKEWGVQPRAIDEYMSRARELMRDQAEKRAGEAFDEAVARLENLYEMCVGAADRKTAASVAKQLNDLHGLNVQRMDLTSKGEAITKVTVEIKKPRGDGGEFPEQQAP